MPQARQYAGTATAHDDFRDIRAARILDHGAGDVGGRHNGRARTQVLRQFQRLQDAFALACRQALQTRRFHVQCVPFRIQLAGQARRAADHVFAPRVRSHAGQQRGARLPHGIDGFLDAVGLHVVLHPVRRAAQGQFAQGDQVTLAEKMLGRPLGLLRLVYLALLEAAQQFVGRDIDQHHFIGAVEHRVGQGFGHAHAGNSPRHVVQAFQVLHVHGRQHIDAGRQQFLDVLPALRMARTGHVRMGQFIHQYQRRRAQQGLVQVELEQGLAPVLDGLQGKHRQAVQLGRRILAPMRLHHAHQQVLAIGQQFAGGGQHRVGLADAGRGAEINAQPAACGFLFLRLHLRQQGIRVGALAVVGEHVVF